MRLKNAPQFELDHQNCSLSTAERSRWGLKNTFFALFALTSDKAALRDLNKAAVEIAAAAAVAVAAAAAAAAVVLLQLDPKETSMSLRG